MDLITQFEKRFEEGEIIPYLFIYDVDFKPEFIIKQNLGYLADKMKRYYKSTMIINDSAKQNIESIQLEKDNIRTLISFPTFRTVMTAILNTDIDFKPIKNEVDNIFGRLTTLINSPRGVAIRGQRLELEITRIGVRFIFITKLEQEHLLNFDRSRMFNDKFNKVMYNGPRKLNKNFGGIKLIRAKEK